MIPASRNEVLGNLGTLTASCIADDDCDDVVFDGGENCVFLAEDGKILLVAIHLR